jgi:hypothetical protein
MPATFSASTCISSNNTSPGPFNIYLDSDYTSTPFSSATLSQLTNCPFVIVVPTGTTSLGFKDTLLDFCFETTIQDNNICSNCNLGLSNYSSSTITQLSCGILTGTCQNINDYVINWYGPNDTTTLEFTSGAGSFLTPNMIPHPFTGINSRPLPEGVYTPVISKIKLSGITFSNTGGTGSVLFSGNCLPSTTILPLTCSNQTNPSTVLPYSAYKHYVSYEFLNGDVPTPINLTYKVSASTQFFAWRFRGTDNPDRIQIKFSGASYGSNKLGLEDFFIGNNGITSNLNPTVFPKSAQTLGYLTKLTCLTGLTVNNNDNILITITPGNTETVWDLYSTCLNSYNCTSCLFTNPYKIIGSTITGITSSCFSQVNFSISGGCNQTTYTSSDLYKYYINTNGFGYQSIQNIAPAGSGLSQLYDNPINYYSTTFYNNSNVCSEGPEFELTPNCATDTNNVKYEKTFVSGIGSKGIFNITGSSTVISSYYNSWVYLKTNFSGSSSSTNASYYRRFNCRFPGPTTSNNCIENVSYQNYYFHPSSTVSTGLTSSGSYYFRITAETISNNFTALTSCDINCLTKSDAYVSLINNSSTGVTSDFNREFIYSSNTLNFGVYYTNPFYGCYSMNQSVQTQTLNTIGAKLETNQWTTNTIPYSGISNTLIPSLSGTVCNYNLSGATSSIYNNFYNINMLYYYYIVKPTLTDFEIWSAPIISYSANTNQNDAILAYRYSGGNVTYSSSTYIIG